MLAAFVTYGNSIYPFKHIMQVSPLRSTDLMIRLVGTDHSFTISFTNFDVRKEQLENFKKYLTVSLSL